MIGFNMWSLERGDSGADDDGDGVDIGIGKNTV